MKRKTKKRIELLELAIKAAEERYKQLAECHNPLNCPLCQNMNLFDGCKNCPATNANYRCLLYSLDVANIQSHLAIQIIEWENEIERLKKT